MNDRLAAVRAKLEMSDISSASLVVLASVAAYADHNQDLATLEETLVLARTIAATTEVVLRDEAERLAAVCEKSLNSDRPIWWDE